MLVPGRQQPGLCTGTAAGLTLDAESSADSVLSSCDLGKSLAEEGSALCCFLWLNVVVGLFCGLPTAVLLCAQLLHVP